MVLLGLGASAISLNLPTDSPRVSVVIVFGIVCAIAGFIVARFRYKSSKQSIEDIVEKRLAIQNQKLKGEIDNLIAKQLADLKALTTIDFNRLLGNLNRIIPEIKSVGSENYRHLCSIIIDFESRLVRAIENLETSEKQRQSESTKSGNTKPEEHTEKVNETEPVQSTPDDSKLPERAKAILPKARARLQTADVSREVLALLPVEVLRLDFQPIHHRIILQILDMTADRVKPTITAISGRIHINRQELKTFLQEMINNRFIKTEVEGKTVLYFPAKTEFIRNLYQPVFKNCREGGEIAFELLRRTREEWRDLHGDWLLITLRQIPDKDMPDAIILPPLSKGGREGWSFYDAIAVEFETQEEIRAHPEQVLFNMIKNFAIGFKKVLFCGASESFDKLLELSQRLLADIEDIIASSIACFGLK